MPSDGGSLLVLKHQPKGQASHLPHTSRSPLEHTPPTDETCRCHPGTLPLPHSRAPVSPGRELLHVSGVPIFVAAAQGTALCHLALVASGLAVPQDCTYLHVFKSCCLRVWIPISLSVDAEIQSTGTLICLGTFPTTESY